MREEKIKICKIITATHISPKKKHQGKASDQDSKRTRNEHETLENPTIPQVHLQAPALLKLGWLDEKAWGLERSKRYI